jgi:hypothetical protein
MTNTDPQTTPCASAVHEIRLKGHLGTQWTDWFDGMAVTWEEDGSTTLTGVVADQAALHGLFKRIRDLGLPLLAVNCISDTTITQEKR